MKKSFIIFASFIIFHFPVFSQLGYVDSIWQQANLESKQTNKADALAKVATIAIDMHSPLAKTVMSELDSLAKLSNKPWIKGLSLLNNAYYATEFGNNDIQAMEKCMKALEIFKENNLKRGIIMANNRLAFLFLWDQIENKNSAYREDIYKKYLVPSLQLAVEIKDTDLIINTYDFIGSYWNVSEKNYPLATQNFNLGERYILNNTAPEICLGILGSSVITYAEVGDEQKMLNYLHRCETLPWFGIFGYASNNMYRSVAQYYLNKKPVPNFQLALSYAKKSYSIALKMNALKYLSLSENRMYEIYSAMGKSDSALLYLQKHNVHEDSLQHEKFELYLVDYSMQKKEGVIVRQQGRLDKKNFFIYSISTLFIISMFLLWLLFKNREKNRQLQLRQLALEKEKAISKAREEERQRIIADLHDDVGAGLSSILMISQLLLQRKNQIYSSDTYANKISGITKDVSQRMNTIIWAFNQENDTLQNLYEYIHHYGSHFFENSNISFYSKFPEGISNFSINGLQRKNIFMCVKEAFNNTYKHSSAKNAKVHFIIENNILAIAIADDGLQAKTEKNQIGNGLKNMKKRMDEIGASLIIEKTDGTIVWLTNINLTNQL